MQLSFSTNAYTRFPLEHALRDIRAAGYEWVEILADVPHAYPAAIDAAGVASVRRTLDELGLRVANINCNCSFGYWKHAPPEPYFEPSLISPDARFRSDRMDLIRRAIDFAAEVESPAVSITSGRMLAWVDPTHAAKLLAENLAMILDYADARNIDVGIELEPGLFLEYVPELVDWIARLGHRRLGANLDIGHSQVLGEDIAESVRMLGGRIWNLHVEDIPGRKHYHMIPGQGTLDWPALFRALREVGYRRSVTVELYTHTAEPGVAARESYRFLKPWVG